MVDGREVTPVPGALEDALAPARDAPAPLVILDTYERMAALDTFLRRDLLAQLPARAIAVTGGRRPPATGWSQHGWEAVSAELPLRPLDRAEAEAMLARHGVADPVAARRMAAWAAGSPLALAILAGSARLPGRFHPERRDVVATLLSRLVDEGLDERRLDVLAVAANARSVTPALLRATQALGGRRLAGLDVVVASARFEAHLVDWGPGGLLGAQRDLVYRELGLPPPRGGAGPVAADVRHALAALHRPARSPAARWRAARPSRSVPRRCGRSSSKRSTTRSATRPTSARCARC